MRFSTTILFFGLLCSSVKAQEVGMKWYSKSNTDGIVIQNSFPKGGKYTGPTKNYFNSSYLVFFTRVVNGTGDPIELKVDFSANPVAIPNSPDTFVKLFLPTDTMTPEKQKLFSYGVTELDSFEKSTRFQKTLNPDEDCLFYVVAFFYQSKEGQWNQERGGNRAELVLKGQDLFYKMSPQIDSLPCGTITLKN